MWNPTVVDDPFVKVQCEIVEARALCEMQGTWKVASLSSLFVILFPWPRMFPTL